MDKQITRAAAPPATSLTTTSTAKLLADLQDGQLSAIEAALVAVRDLPGQDAEQARQALMEQGIILQALGMKLIRVAGAKLSNPLAPTLLNLGLRAMDLSRKSLASLTSLPGASATQANVQVNIGRTNELLDGDGKRLVG